MIRRLDVEPVRDDDYPLAVRREVREPVVELVIVGDAFGGTTVLLAVLLVLGTVGTHAPDLHLARAYGVEVDPLAVRAHFRSVIQPRVVGQVDFLATAVGGRLVYVVLVAVGGPGASAAGVHQPFRVRRPAMHVAGRERRDALGHAAAR